MEANRHSAPQFVSDERIADLERQGQQARQRGDRRSAHGFMPGIERKAFERGWDCENEQRN